MVISKWGVSVVRPREQLKWPRLSSGRVKVEDSTLGKSLEDEAGVGGRSKGIQRKEDSRKNKSRVTACQPSYRQRQV